MQVNQGDLVIEIGGEGKVKAMHSDAFDLAFLGSKQVRRQTEIKFNETTQKWDIHFITDSGAEVVHENLNDFAGYEAARSLEVLWVNSCRLHALVPESEEGLKYAGWLRWADTRQCFPIEGGKCISHGRSHAAQA